MSNILYDLEEIIDGTILNRPSKKIKSPYVADVLIKNPNNPLENIEVLAHCPSLGCCGYSDKGANIYLIKNKNDNVKTSYTVVLSIFQEIKNEIEHREIIGLHPKISEKIGFNAIKQNCIKSLMNVKLLEKEKKFENSRFDIYGIDENNQEFILEIKTVPLADYVDCPKKERYLMEETINSRDWNQKISYFPDGYRKNKSEPVSPRALKHIQELEKIALIGKYKCYLLFIIQRIDVFCFQTSVIDPIYKDAVKKASDNGVNILTLQVNWNKEDCKAYYYPNDLAINL